MKIKQTILSAVLLAAGCSLGAQAEVTMTLFDNVTFYDGYLVGNIPEDAPDEGCTRLYTYLNTVKLTEEQLSKIGDKLDLDVTIHAACDNYDRIGGVRLALVPKGQESYTVNYNAEDPAHIEVARFITPFMNKNISPTSVPYHFEINHIGLLLRDAKLREKYDFWVEFMLFGVPYAAQTQVAGCAGCIDVFRGTMTLTTTDEPAPLVNNAVNVPVTCWTADWRADRGINNYDENCTDEVGECIRTYAFEVPENCTDGRVYFITSNHGANSGGEEYNRRWHYMYFDEVEQMSFRPGRTSCEPFRQYNTQANGIYGTRPQTDAQWQSFSNWCPGDVLDIRWFDVGEVTAGTHSVMIWVPDARFRGKEGYIPVSVGFQGVTEGKLPDMAGLATVIDEGQDGVELSYDGETLKVTGSKADVSYVEVYDTTGAMRRYTKGSQLNTKGLPQGVYVVSVILEDGTTENVKFAL